MRRLREKGGSVPPTAVSIRATRPAADVPVVPSALQVVVAAWNRTLSSDARTERALRLLRPILFAGVLTILGVAFTVVAISATDAWWSLICGLGVTIVNAGIAIVRRHWKKSPLPASVVVPTPREAPTSRTGSG
jgi:hypothetical protein